MSSGNKDQNFLRQRKAPLCRFPLLQDWKNATLVVTVNISPVFYKCRFGKWWQLLQNNIKWHAWWVVCAGTVKLCHSAFGNMLLLSRVNSRKLHFLNPCFIWVMTVSCWQWHEPLVETNITLPEISLHWCHMHTSKDIQVIRESWMKPVKWHTGLFLAELQFMSETPNELQTSQ